MRVAPAIKLSAADEEWLQKHAHSAVSAHRLHERCRIVLRAAAGETDKQIAAHLHINRKKAARWRARFLASGRVGLEVDAPGRGRKPTYPPELREVIVRKTTRTLPPAATQWSRVSMAQAMDVSPSTVGRIWRAHGLEAAWCGECVSRSASGSLGHSRLTPTTKCIPLQTSATELRVAPTPPRHLLTRNFQRYRNSHVVLPFMSQQDDPAALH